MSEVSIGEESKTKARVIDSLLFRHWNAWQAPTRAHIIHVPLNGTPRDLTRQLHESLERLGTDHADLYLMHRDNEDVPVDEFVDVHDAFDGCDAIAHLAAKKIPRFGGVVQTLEVNVGGAINVLEAARRRRTPVIFASTNKVYGDLADVVLDAVTDGRGCRSSRRSTARVSPVSAMATGPQAAHAR